MEHKVKVDWKYVPWVASILMAFWAWLVFNPGFMNADAIVIYIHAYFAKYDDWHPPILSFVMRFFIWSGWGPGAFMFLHSTWSFLGMCLLVLETLRFVRVPESKIYHTGTIVLLILWSPLFPFPFFAMTFLKDSWCAITLLWITGLSFMILRRRNEQSMVRSTLSMLLLMLNMVVCILARHNAIVLLPIFTCIIIILCRRGLNVSVARSILMAVVPIIAVVLFDFVAYRVIGVKRTHPERQVYAAELVGLVYSDSSRCPNLPYICRNLTPEWRQAYTYGEVYPVMSWGYMHSVEIPPFNEGSPKVESEYFKSLKKYPIGLFMVKTKAFMHMITPSPHRYWFHHQLDDNKYELRLNETFTGIRDLWIRLTLMSHKFAILRYIGAEHVTWLLINILFIGVAFAQRKMSLLLILMMAIPFCYYFSYFLATTGWDYRFMYPATLLMEVFSACALARLFLRPRTKVFSFLSNGYPLRDTTTQGSGTYPMNS